MHLSHTQEVDEDGVTLCGKEKWRSKILSSLLCSSSDITARCIKENIAFQSYCKLWIQGSKIPLTIKIHLYDATCVSQMYDCNSWAAPKKFLDKLDACHHRHLHTITGHRRPDSVISSDALYKMCNVVPLSVKIEPTEMVHVRPCATNAREHTCTTSAGICSTGIQQIQIPYRPSLLKPVQLIVS